MKIEDYVIGAKRDDTFCYYLGEIPGFGALGKYSSKYGVYWIKDENRYFHNKRYPDYITAYEAVKKTIDSLIHSGQEFERTRNWNKIADDFVNSDKILKTVVKSKILGIYFPERFISIHSLEGLRKILDYFEISYQEFRSNHMLLQEKIFEIKNSHPIMKNWDNRDFTHFLWVVIVAKNPPVTDPPVSGDMDELIDKIIMEEFELAIKPELVERILLHLKAGKHVVLVGPPGVGKTVLAKRILKIFGPTGDQYIPSVASQEWTRYHLIGGLDLERKNFHKGHLTTAVEEGKWLLIDEFNRADINKAFGELFLAIEDLKIPLSEDEKQVLKRDFIEIPKEFRMICTMNDFDKNLLLTELSYGLITRFAFVDVEPDKQKERNSVRDQLLESDKENLIENYEKCEKQIDSFFKFINDVRKERKIGVRTSLDIVKYLVISSDGKEENDRWNNLDNALCDYLLPQLDRLDRPILDFVKKCMDDHFPENSIKKSQLKLEEMIQQLRMMAGFLDVHEDE